jgi:hypothetical protein
MKEDDRIALLAGAGLGANAGLPMSIELAVNLRKRLTAMTHDAGGTSDAQIARSTAERWLSLFNFLNGGVHFQEGVLGRDPDAQVNIEQIAIAAEELIARSKNPLAPYAAGWHRRIDELESQDDNILRSFLEFTYSGLREELTLADPHRAAYMERVRDLGIDSRGIDIFSLNYDVCIETALRNGNVKFANGFNREGQWIPATFRDRVSIRLFKLHGSLDWIDDEIYGLCSLEFPKHQIAETIETSQTRPTLIFGTAHKLSAREPFLTLAYHFAQRVLRTEILAVIGYSFGDEHVNQIIEQGIKKNARLRVVVVSPRAKDCITKVKFLDKDPRVFPIEADAKTALNDGTLRDQIKRCLQDAAEEAPFN